MLNWRAWVIGAAIGTTVPVAQAPLYVTVQSTPSQTIILHFVSRTEVAAQCDDPRATACSRYWFPHRLGPWAEVSEPEQFCEIWLPQGALIAAVPGLLSAQFVDPRQTNDLAHEILHCSSGGWHGTPAPSCGRQTDDQG
jgi:hypothetical protein